MESDSTDLIRVPLSFFSGGWFRPRMSWLPMRQSRPVRGWRKRQSQARHQKLARRRRKNSGRV